MDGRRGPGAVFCIFNRLKDGQQRQERERERRLPIHGGRWEVFSTHTIIASNWGRGIIKKIN